MAGPTAAERARGLGTAISPTSGLALRGLRDGVADVEVGDEGAQPVPDRLPLAVGRSC
ncbi:hypothetical protein GCM10025868_18100 [Angustibacter aerolatus]|uniref:Uncharacterized protein n=1 Tax=Angustibacter aerolatus TaxID=1162965 RepID=A0ABQ6JIB3_9ACTN|nr:hypothetical protein [Angustibacter aerolatus]GMA86560.1 hypothetical protein GCM10025868_18100 [Angustibacter aerolatus]